MDVRQKTKLEKIFCCPPYMNVLMLVVIGLGACTITPPAPPVQSQTFAHLPSLNWQANYPKISYAQSLQSVTHPTGTPSTGMNDPKMIMTHWVRDRVPFAKNHGQFSAATSTDVQFVVIKAQINEIRSHVPIAPIMPAWFFKRAQIQLTGVLQVKIVLTRADGRARENIIEVHAQLNRQGAISLNELDIGYFKVVQRLSTAVDTQLEIYLRREKIIL